jgi:hypothetical protein
VPVVSRSHPNARTARQNLLKIKEYANELRRISAAVLQS